MPTLTAEGRLAGRQAAGRQGRQVYYIMQISDFYRFIYVYKSRKYQEVIFINLHTKRRKTKTNVSKFNQYFVQGWENKCFARKCIIKNIYYLMFN